MKVTSIEAVLAQKDSEQLSELANRVTSTAIFLQSALLTENGGQFEGEPDQPYDTVQISKADHFRFLKAMEQYGIDIERISERNKSFLSQLRK